MDELTKQIGYQYNFWGPGNQIVYLSQGYSYQPLWYHVYDRPGLVKDLMSVRRYETKYTWGQNVVQLMTPWGDVINIYE